MSEWKEMILEECIDIKHGYAFKGENITNESSDIVLVTPGNFHVGGGFKASKFKFYNGHIPDEYIFKGGEIVVTMTDLSKESDTLGYSAKIPKDNNTYLHNQRIGLVKLLNDEVFPDYIYWLLRTREYQWFIVGSASGTSVMHTSPSRIKEFSFRCPPLPEQKAIAGVLSILDDKIDLLHRQNKTLEAMAETLFKQWFIEEAEDEWEEITLKDFVKCITGYSYKSINLQPSHETALVNLKNFSRDGSFNLAGLKEYTGPYKESQLVSKGDLIVAHTDITQNAAIIGQPALMIDTGKYKNLVISTDLVKVVPTTDLLDTYFLYYLFKSPDFRGYAVGMSNGTTVIHLSKKAIPDYSFSIPNFNIVRDFSEKVRANLIMINDNNSQISKLRIIRDLLLPKLMSGEVRVEL